MARGKFPACGDALKTGNQFLNFREKGHFFCTFSWIFFLTVHIPVLKLSHSCTNRPDTYRNGDVTRETA
jgi:hypothetical protein